MRHTGFCRLTVVNETLGFWGVTILIIFYFLSYFYDKIKHDKYIFIIFLEKHFLEKIIPLHCLGKQLN